MRSFLPQFEMRRAADVNDVLALLASEPGAWRPFAGGTDLMVTLDAGTLRHQRYVSLWGIPELRGVEVTDTALSIGAMTTYTDLLKHPIVREEFSLLCEAASQTGGVATQNRGTIGGNIANGSPAADTPPALLVYDAELELISVRGTRKVPYDRFHTGYKTSDLAGDELIARVHLPRPPSTGLGTGPSTGLGAGPSTGLGAGRRGWTEMYRKVGTRRAQAIAKVCFAAAARLDGSVVSDIRLALGSVAPTVVRATATERVLRGHRLDSTIAAQAVETLMTELAPIDDIRSTARYRAFVARQLLLTFLESLGGPRRA